jgi:hypothetical protein
MADWEDVRRVALSLPEAEERLSREHRQWRVKDKLFVWERPLGKRDLAALGDAAPDGVILAVRVPDEGAKHALIAAEPEIFFTIPHFNGYPAVLIRLDDIGLAELEEIIVEAWLDRAPKRLAAGYLAGGDTGG